MSYSHFLFSIQGLFGCKRLWGRELLGLRPAPSGADLGADPTSDDLLRHSVVELLLCCVGLEHTVKVVWFPLETTAAPR